MNEYFSLERMNERRKKKEEMSAEFKYPDRPDVGRVLRNTTHDSESPLQGPRRQKQSSGSSAQKEIEQILVGWMQALVNAYEAKKNGPRSVETNEQPEASDGGLKALAMQRIREEEEEEEQRRQRKSPVQQDMDPFRDLFRV